MLLVIFGISFVMCIHRYIMVRGLSIRQLGGSDYLRQLREETADTVHHEIAVAAAPAPKVR